ncbi:MAG: PilZ domain-containing protein [Desulfurivibrio sp.]|nr:PilZ domain-containing protein [Desulfurivibrio sp.]
MTKPVNSAQDKALLAGWVEFGDGVHATRSDKIIQQALRTIQKQHIFCMVVTKGYESGKVALLKFGNGRIVLDKPVDWPRGMKLQPLRILFKDKSQLWNQFAVQLREVAEDTLVTSMPERYIRLQRRSNYRVGVPRGSRLSFTHRGEVKEDFFVVNVSANGSLICREGRGSEIPLGDPIQDITLSFPREDGELEKVTIRQGRVVRSATGERREPCFGMQFLLKTKEEQQLMQYVRLRERELLRRGMAEES